MRKITAFFVLLTFVLSCIMPPQGFAQTLTAVGIMPQPGIMVALSGSFTPAHLKGMVINPADPFKFDFIINRGDEQLTIQQKQEEYKKLVKYFLASLAVPDTDQWVNLSPYEKERIIPDNFGLTEMGRDLLAQDYLLKQISATLTNPDSDLGKKFWDGVYAQAYEKYGTTDIQTDTFNKVWIVPSKAVVYEKGNTVYVLEHHLKVMTEKDYLATKENKQNVTSEENGTTLISQNVMREIIIPAIEKEVNEGKNFAPLRQVHSSMLLASWYKLALKESILGKLYADRGKVKGVDQDPKNNQEIYGQYVQAFKRGVFNMIKEDVDRYTQEVVPRKYFSGGDSNQYPQVLQRVLGDTNPNPVAEDKIVDEAKNSDDAASVEVVKVPDVDVVQTGYTAMSIQINEVEETQLGTVRVFFSVGEQKKIAIFADRKFYLMGTHQLGAFSRDDLSKQIQEVLQHQNEVISAVSAVAIFSDRPEYPTSEMINGMKQSMRKNNVSVGIGAIQGKRFILTLQDDVISKLAELRTLHKESTGESQPLVVIVGTENNPYVKGMDDIDFALFGFYQLASAFSENLRFWVKFQDLYSQQKIRSKATLSEIKEQLKKQNVIFVVTGSNGEHVPITGREDYTSDDRSLINKWRSMNIARNLHPQKVTESELEGLALQATKAEFDATSLSLRALSGVLRVTHELPNKLGFGDLAAVRVEIGSSDRAEIAATWDRFKAIAIKATGIVAISAALLAGHSGVAVAQSDSDKRPPKLGTQAGGVTTEGSSQSWTADTSSALKILQESHGNKKNVTGWQAVIKSMPSGMQWDIRTSNNVVVMVKPADISFGETISMQGGGEKKALIGTPVKLLEVLSRRGANGKLSDKLKKATLKMELARVILETHPDGSAKDVYGIEEISIPKPDFSERVGGIDFAQSNLSMQIKRDGAGIPLPVNQQDLDGIHIDGLIPVILNIQPAANVPLFSEAGSSLPMAA